MDTTATAAACWKRGCMHVNVRWLADIQINSPFEKGGLWCGDVNFQKVGRLHTNWLFVMRVKSLSEKLIERVRMELTEKWKKIVAVGAIIYNSNRFLLYEMRLLSRNGPGKQNSRPPIPLHN